MVYWFSQLYRSKWRFASLPDLFNIFRASTILALTLLVVDYILVSPQLLGTFFFGKITIALYWLIQMFLLGGPRLAFRYVKYARSRHTLQRDSSTPTLLLGRGSDIEVILRAIEAGTVKKIQPKGILSYRADDLGQSMRGVPVLGTFADLDQVVQDFQERGVPIRRLVATPSALTPEANPGHAARPRAPPRPAAGAGHEPRRRHARCRACAARDRRPAPAPHRADRPAAARELHPRQARARHRRRRLHRVGDLHPRRWPSGRATS